MDALARPRLAALWLPLLLSLAVAPAAAAAPQPRVESSLRADGTTVIRYVAPPGQDNELLLRVRAEALDPYKRQQGILNDTGIDFYDVGADGISFKGPLCGPQGTGVGCDVTGTKVEVQVALGDGDDVVTPEYDAARHVPVKIDGGPGSDALQVRGNVPTAIDFKGGPGVDAVDYFDRSRLPYAFSDEGLANDGLGADNIRPDVELYVGGDGNDRFAFSGTGRHIVFGTGGDDTMISGPGPDEFDGGYGGDPQGTDAPSNDTVSYAGRSTGVSVTLDGAADDGAPGEGDQILPTVEHVIGTDNADTLIGPASAPDNRPYRLEGGGGADVLSGGGGVDLIDAGSGDDTVIALGGGRDAVKCGGGVDVAVVDKSDPTRDCEQVLHSYLQGAASQTGDSVRVQVAIPVPRSIVKATLMSGGTPVGTDTVRFRAGIQTLSVALDAAGKSALGKAGSLPLKLRVQIAPPGRAAVKASRRVTLSAK